MSALCHLRANAPQQKKHRNKRKMCFRAIYTIISSERALGGRRHVETERRGGLEIDHELDCGRLHDRQIAEFGATQNAAGIDAGLAIGIRDVGSVANQPARFGELAERIDRWQAGTHNRIAARICSPQSGKVNQLNQFHRQDVGRIRYDRLERESRSDRGRVTEIGA